MYRTLTSASLLAAVLTLNAQTTVHQVLVLNEGYYDMSTQTQVVPVSLGSYDPAAGTYQTVVTIADARFGNHVAVDNGAIYVAADSFLLKYDADNFQLLDQTIVHGIRHFAVADDRIVCTQGEVGGLPHYVEVLDKATLDLLYSIDSATLPYSCQDVEIADGKAYIAVNNGFDWGNAVGLVGVLDLATDSWTGTIDLGPEGKNPENLMVTADAIYAFNNKDFSGSSISKIGRSSGALTYTNNVAVNSGCAASALADGNIYFLEYAQSQLARFHLGSDAVLDTLAGSPFVYGLLDDPINSIMYATTTDFLTSGDLHVMGYDGTVLNTVAVGVAPGRLALDLRSTSGIAEANEVKGSVFPNPANELISIRLPQMGAFTIVDATGRTVRADRTAIGLTTASMNVEGLATGLYSVLQNGTLIARFTKQ
ncbi:MAG: T9SS type A sorting domain-containing protein [Flavobacteriales bacterium]|nr:T9SS type A sorting domain-containing protein [Flavobacteriales bacterium]